MDSESLVKIIREQTAIKMIETLSEKERQVIISKSIANVLAELNLGWETRKILTKEALHFAHEYAQKPEVQDRLRTKAKEAVDSILDGVVNLIGKAIEDDIKNSYVRILSKGE